MFLILNVGIGLQFCFWGRYWETGRQSWTVGRPPGVEGGLPIASLMKLVGGTRVSPIWIAAGIASVFLGLVLVARVTGNWHTEIPDDRYQELVPRAEQYFHP